MITLTPAARAYIDAAYALDDALTSGGMVKANDLLAAAGAARATLVAEGWTDEDIDVLAHNFL